MDQVRAFFVTSRLFSLPLAQRVFLKNLCASTVCSPFSLLPCSSFFLLPISLDLYFFSPVHPFLVIPEAHWIHGLGMALNSPCWSLPPSRSFWPAERASARRHPVVAGVSAFLKKVPLLKEGAGTEAPTEVAGFCQLLMM